MQRNVLTAYKNGTIRYIDHLFFIICTSWYLLKTVRFFDHCVYV